VGVTAFTVRGQGAVEWDGRWAPLHVDANGAKQSLVVVDVSRVTQAQSIQSTGEFAALIGGASRAISSRYEVVKKLGRGGMGVVVKAKDNLLHREVAIKMLAEEFADNPEVQQIFLTEARALATLAHPNLVSIYDVTEIDGRAMIVFEYVEGHNLEDLFLEHGALYPGELLRVGIQLARGLDYLHTKEVIHRDLKPANVMIQSDGTLRVIDFGLARSLEQLSLKGTMVRGTPAYMAPEQILGKDLTPKTDIYQFGVTLFELWTGSLPFPDGDMVYRHVHDEPPELDTLREGLPPEISRLIHAMLAKKPTDRPDAQRIAAVIEAVYTAQPMIYDAHKGLVNTPPNLFRASSSGVHTLPKVAPKAAPELQWTPADESAETAILIQEAPAPNPAQPAQTIALEDTDHTSGANKRRLGAVLVAMVLGAALVGGVAFAFLNMAADTLPLDAPMPDDRTLATSAVEPVAGEAPTPGPDDAPFGDQVDRLASDAAASVVDAAHAFESAEAGLEEGTEEGTEERDGASTPTRVRQPRKVAAKSRDTPKADVPEETIEPEDVSPEPTSPDPSSEDEGKELAAEVEVEPEDEDPIEAATKDEDPADKNTTEKQPATRKVIKKKVIRKKVIRRVKKKDDEPPPRSF